LPGLEPGILVFTTDQDVDGRDKRGHDGRNVSGDSVTLAHVPEKWEN
jgi:hypothetical protein